MVEINWEHLLQVAKKCTRYACKAMQEPYSDDLESEGQYLMYKFAMQYKAGKANGRTVEQFVAFNVIRLVKQYIQRNRKRGKRYVIYKSRADMAEVNGVEQAEGMLSNVNKEDEEFITQLLNGEPCKMKNEMIAKYCPQR